MNAITRKFNHPYLIQIFAASCISLFLMAMPVMGQKAYKIAPTGNKILVKGTSNLHDWDSNTDQVNGDMMADVDGNVIKQFKNVSIKIPVNSIKSGKSLMDSKTMEALNNVKFPLISFQSSAISVKPNNTVVAAGQLTISGVTKGINITATYSIQKDGSIIFKGIVKLKMTDYSVKPPTYMMGMLKTGDDTEIDFNVIYKQ